MTDNQRQKCKRAYIISIPVMNQNSRNISFDQNMEKQKGRGKRALSLYTIQQIMWYPSSVNEVSFCTTPRRQDWRQEAGNSPFLVLEICWKEQSMSISSERQAQRQLRVPRILPEIAIGDAFRLTAQFMSPQKRLIFHVNHKLACLPTSLIMLRSISNGEPHSWIAIPEIEACKHMAVS